MISTQEYKERTVSGTAILVSISLEEGAVIDKPRTFRRRCAFLVPLLFCRTQYTSGVCH